MNLNQIQRAYFLGIGGIGMSAIARYFNAQGISVAGYDRTETPLTKELTEEGIRIHYQDLGNEVADWAGSPESCLVVLTPAIPTDHAEWNWLRENGYTILKRSQVLGLITDAYRTIGIAGTHGKTTTSTLTAHLLKQSQVDCAAFLGGISSNYGTNLLQHKQSGVRETQYMVVEADEFDRSFLTLHPWISVITSTDADHLDIYGAHEALKKSFVAFGSQTRNTLIVKKSLEWNQPWPESVTVYSYSADEPADFYAERIRIQNGVYHFDLHLQEHIVPDVELGMPGKHNVENAVAAAACAFLSGVTLDEIKNGLLSFRGVKRRFEYIIRNDDMVYIDDYAHHPEEIRAILMSVKNMYPYKKLTVVFQPHLFSRTRDFATGFAESLSLADAVILLDIYPARELPIPGITSAMLLEGIRSADKQLCSKEALCSLIREKQPGLLLTLGAGDIDQFVIPIAETLKSLHGIG